MKIKLGSIVIVVCALLGAAAVGVYSHFAAAKAQEGGGGKGKRGGTVSVRTKQAERMTLTEYVETNGDISAVNSVAVYPSMGGKVAGAAVSLGDSVAKNQLVMRIDPSEPGSYYALSPIYAPIAGTVISTPLKMGTKVTTSTAVLTIGDISKLEMTAYIAERDVAQMKTGLHADVSLEAYPLEVFKASVTKVSPVVDANTRTKEVRLVFDTSDTRVNAGMFGQVKLYTKAHPDVIAVPIDAVVTKGDKDVVFTAQGDSAVMHEVKTGVSVLGMVEIISGISEGEEVVVEGARSLSDGGKITVVGKGGNAAAGGKGEINGKGKDDGSGEGNGEGRGGGTKGGNANNGGKGGKR